MKNVKAAGEKLHNAIKEQRGDLEISGLQGRDTIHRLFKSNHKIPLEGRRTKKR